MPILIKGSGGAKPKLQSKTITPSTSTRSYTPDSGYDGFDKITISARPSSVTPTGGNATAADVRKGQTFYSGGNFLTGTMPDATLPVPSLFSSFENGNTRLKIIADYRPTAGYVSSTNKVYLTKTLNIPESSMAQSMCEYRSGTIYSGSPDSNDYYRFVIEGVSGKTLKYAIITQSQSGAQTPSAESFVTSIYVDRSAETVHVTISDYDHSYAVFMYTQDYTPAYPADIGCWDYGDGGYCVEIKGVGVYYAYNCLAVYQ